VTEKFREESKGKFEGRGHKRGNACGSKKKYSWNVGRHILLIFTMGKRSERDPEAR